MGPRDNVSCSYGAHTPGRSGSRIDSGLYGPYLAPDDGRNQSGIDLFITDQFDVGGLYHSIGSLDHRYETHTFDHSKCLHNFMCSKSPQT
jgi:hypothetical protein